MKEDLFTILERNKLGSGGAMNFSATRSLEEKKCKRGEREHTGERDSHVGMRK
jgi:hypothetical protein